MSSDISERSRGISLILALLLGWVGGHRYYNGKVATGVAQTLTLGGCGLWWIYDIVLDDRKALYVGEQRFPVPEDAIVELKARWPKQTILHVRSADLKADLSAIELITGLGLIESRMDHPGLYTESNIVHPSAQSPLTLKSLKAAM